MDVINGDSDKDSKFRQDIISPAACATCAKDIEYPLSSTMDGATLRSPKVPNGGYGWAVVFASFVVHMISDGISFSFGLIYIEFLNYFGQSKEQTAWIGSLFLALPLLCGPVASALVDRFGCRKMTFIGGVFASLGFILSSFVNSLEMMYLTFGVLSGFGLALSYVAAIVIVACYFDTKRSLATGLAVCGTGIGTFIFAPFVAYLIEEFTWRGAVLILGGIFLNICVCGMLMRDLDCIKVENLKSIDSTNSSNLDSFSQSSKNAPFHTLELDRLSTSLFLLPTFISNGTNRAEIKNNNGTTEVPIPQNEFKLSNSNTSSLLKPNIENDSLTIRRKSLENILNESNEELKRNNVTYRGAMVNIRHYSDRSSSCPNIFQSSNKFIYSKNKKFSLLADLKGMIMDLYDPVVFKSIPFLVFCASNFLLYIWYDVPYIYMPDFAILHGHGEPKASFIISIIGILSTFGTVLFGYIGDKSKVNPALLYSFVLTLCGLVLIFLPSLKSYWSHCVVAGLYGFFISVNYSLIVIIVVKIISFEHFTNAYGILFLGQGIANLIGPPICGLMFDLTGSYDLSFYSAGVGIILSGLMMIYVAKICSFSAKILVNDKPVQTVVKFDNGQNIVSTNHNIQI